MNEIDQVKKMTLIVVTYKTYLRKWQIVAYCCFKAAYLATEPVFTSEVYTRSPKYKYTILARRYLKF